MTAVPQTVTMRKTQNARQPAFDDDPAALTLQRAWRAALKRLADRIGKVTYESYIRPIRPLSLDHRTVTLGVSSAFALEWLARRHRELIQVALETALGFEIVLHFRVLTEEERAGLTAPPGARAPTPDATAAHERDSGRSAVPPTSCQPSSPPPYRSKRSGLPEWLDATALCEPYRFATFVVGKSNRLAYVSAQAVAALPGRTYNPLFLHGPSGVGKTHLLHAIGHAAREQNERLRIGFIDGEYLTYHFVAAVREQRLEQFRTLCESIDLWLVDDVQFLAGQEHTVEEFFAMYNILHQSGRQIVLASDRRPRELPALDERIRSRFEGGLVAEIEPPDLTTRMSILERLAAARQVRLPREVIYLIANGIPYNVRSLEGALTRLVAYSETMQVVVTVDVAQTVLADTLIEKPTPSLVPKGVSLESIVAAVAEQFGLTVPELRSARRDKQAVTARQVAMFVARQYANAGLTRIGAALGGRDHATVKRSLARITRLIEQDASLAQVVQQLAERLGR